LSLKRDFYFPVFIALIAQKQISKSFTFFAACDNSWIMVVSDLNTLSKNLSIQNRWTLPHTTYSFNRWEFSRVNYDVNISTKLISCRRLFSCDGYWSV